MHKFAGEGLVIWIQYAGGPEALYQVPKSDSGHYLMKNNIYRKNGPNMRKVDVVKKKLDEILMQLNPIEGGFSKSSALQLEYTMKNIVRA